jgi:hypothetical protein
LEVSGSLLVFEFVNVILYTSDVLSIYDATDSVTITNNISVLIEPLTITYFPSNIPTNLSFTLTFSNNAILPENGQIYQLIDNSLNVLSIFNATDSNTNFIFSNIILLNDTSNNIIQTLNIYSQTTSTILYSLEITINPNVINYTPKNVKSGVYFTMTYNNNSKPPIIGHTYKLYDILRNIVLSTYIPSQQTNDYLFNNMFLTNLTDSNTINKTLKIYDETTTTDIDINIVIVVNPVSINTNGDFNILSGLNGFANWNMNGQRINRGEFGQGYSNSVSFAAKLSEGELSILSQSFTTIPNATYKLSYYIYNSGANQKPEIFQALWNGNLISGSVINNSNDTSLNDEKWIKKTFTGLLTTNNLTTIQFIGAQDESDYKLSNVFVTLENMPTVIRSHIPCFKENTKILCLIDNEETYVPIENIRKGVLVKTLKHGYVPVNLIGRSKIQNPSNNERIKERLYICSKQNYPSVFEDLYITGCHSILVEKMTQIEKEKTREMLTMLYKTDDRFRLMACLDDLALPYEKEGEFTIWHLALNHQDYYMNYGIYANGLLVESCSQRYLKELSNMEMIE